MLIFSSRSDSFEHILGREASSICPLPFTGEKHEAVICPQHTPTFQQALCCSGSGRWVDWLRLGGEHGRLVRRFYWLAHSYQLGSSGTSGQQASMDYNFADRMFTLGLLIQRIVNRWQAAMHCKLGTSN